MGRYQYHPHTADEKFSVEAETLEDGFETAHKALVGIMTDSEFDLDLQTEIQLTGTPERLLYDFLNEIITRLDEEYVLYMESSVKIEGNTLKAVLKGCDADNILFRTVIKNMTYSEMKVELDPVRLEVVVDI